MGKQATVDFGKIADAGDNGGKQQVTENLPAIVYTPKRLQPDDSQRIADLRDRNLSIYDNG